MPTGHFSPCSAPLTGASEADAQLKSTISPAALIDCAWCGCATVRPIRAKVASKAHSRNRCLRCRFLLCILLSAAPRSRRLYRAWEECPAGHQLQEVACTICFLFWSVFTFGVVENPGSNAEFIQSLFITYLFSSQYAITCATSSCVIMAVPFLCKGNRRGTGFVDVFYRRLT